MITNIDVTLRDGGYRNSFNFSLDYALAHARSSVASGFDWVEIGYRNGSSRPERTDGLTESCGDDYIAAMAREIGPENIGIMVHPENLGAHDLDEMWNAGARLVRICFSSSDPRRSLDCAQRAVEIGYVVCVNVTRVSTVPPKRLRRIVHAVSDLGVTALYLADSNGSLLPDEVDALVESSLSGQGLAIGLHAHNHLGLALVNTIRAVDAGATWVDSAVLGMGKGAGNLVAEQWLAYLSQRRLGSGRFDLGSLLELSTRLGENVAEAAPRLDLTDMLLGYFDLSIEHSPRLAEILDRHAQVRAAGLLAGALS
ncbi:hypothetical protein C5C31_01445 [Rathayibacter rathayi]|uniref:Pyruvate carboxyltransferase domain-containing protein n=1 Tax=Rathayibacter rathayi TaxID=33887 RepID=A0ABD6WCH0_RATRA|nr:hypothetical protein [Rathayibacter rathayi]AZZ49136.1 hypothetical protein C1O28_07930 [Rathayibacter rathayi]MWV73189.1 hypothetical protein [Rathayibacter rathayi NCPPB 2980 = VKM Ac-1601]PPF16284.1 hypothetical protein C5C04_00410 [Rathayibacter rathayi]PPF25555.1 hypothetical protein C5C34_01720 [Rathayibacter rathayi]PPF51859.1 hypothetical protein C5C08_00420 [Rathayibacter rathayi]